MWIFKSGFDDFLRIYLPGIFGIFLASFFSYDSLNALVYLLIFHFFDVGHLYATMLRTLFNKEELISNPMTILVPIVIAVLSFLWLYLKIPYYWSFYILITVFHNLRQGWGLVRWYEKKNKKFHNNQWFYYIFTIAPFILFHVKKGQENLIYYNPEDFMFYKFLRLDLNTSIAGAQINQENIFYYIGITLYLVSVTLWILKEIKYAIKNSIEYNRICAMLYFSIVYAYAFLLAHSEFQISTILILSHALPYIFIMNKFLDTQVSNNLKKWSILIAVVIVGGLTNLVIEDFYEIEHIFNYTKANISTVEYIITLIYITPIFAHYIWDMYLWKKQRSDNNELYK